jgi:hypothetical protein
MDHQERALVLTLMLKDLELARIELPGWADKPLITNDDGDKLTPNQLYQEVKDDTDFGNRYAQQFLVNHRMMESLYQLFVEPPKGNGQSN